MYMTTVHSDLSNPSTETPSSKVTLDYVKLTIIETTIIQKILYHLKWEKTKTWRIQHHAVSSWCAVISIQLYLNFGLALVLFYVASHIMQLHFCPNCHSKVL